MRPLVALALLSFSAVTLWAESASYTFTEHDAWTVYRAAYDIMRRRPFPAIPTSDWNLTHRSDESLTFRFSDFASLNAGSQQRWAGVYGRLRVQRTPAGAVLTIETHRAYSLPTGLDPLDRQPPNPSKPVNDAHTLLSSIARRLDVVEPIACSLQ